MDVQKITLVVARARNGVIGRDGALPWRLSDDLKHFKALTLGTPMIMGRKTFESLPGLLPQRRHIVLTRNRGWSADGVAVAGTAEQALSLAGPGRVSVIGGAEIYALFLPLASAIELTEVEAEPHGDTWLAPWGLEWTEVSRKAHAADGERPAFSFVRLERRSA